MARGAAQIPAHYTETPADHKDYDPAPGGVAAAFVAEVELVE